MRRDFIVEKDDKEFVDIVKILPKRTGNNGKEILWSDIGDSRIELSVQKFGVRGGNAKSVRMNRFVPICSLLFEWLGLWLGDGLKIQGGELKVFGFSNTELNLIKHFLKFSKECLGIFPSDFNARVSIPPKFKNNIKNIEQRVSKNFGIPKEKFWKTQILKTRNNICIDIKISSRILGLVIDSLFLSTITLTKVDKKLAIAFLKGIIASEGNVHIRRCGRLGEIMIAAHKKIIRFMIRRMLESIGIEPNKNKVMEGCEGVVIHGFHNFKIFQENHLCILHPSKNKNLIRGINGFREIQFRKGEGQLIILNNILSNCKTSHKLSRKLNRSQHAINFHLRHLHEKDFIGKSQINGRKITWDITKNGKEFLKLNRKENCYFSFIPL